MGLLEQYQALFEKVKEALQGVSSLKSILIGEAFRLGELPTALVTPREMVGERLAMASILEYTVNFDVLILIRETEPEDWFTEIIPIMCEAFDALMGDDTLGGKVKALTPTLFSPGEITARNHLFYGGLIRLQAVILHTY